jgi:hypothetical protein
MVSQEKKTQEKKSVEAQQAFSASTAALGAVLKKKFEEKGDWYTFAEHHKEFFQVAACALN